MTDALVTAEKLLQADAVRLSPKAPFTWASGWKSPIYCDNRKVYPFLISGITLKANYAM
jgi:orotate phosphoribosyltransferase